MRIDPSSRARLALGLLVLFLPVAVAAEDGPITLRIRGEYQQDSRRFVVEGETDLPDHTVLGLMIYFCGEAVPGAVARGEVLAGHFTIAYGPIDRHLLSGVYDLVVRYMAFDQVAAIQARLKDRPEEKSARVSSYCGTREAEGIETTQIRDRLKKGLDRTRFLYGDLRTKAKEYLQGNKEFREPEFVAWANDWRARHGGLEELIREIGPDSVFAPRFPESVRDLSVISSFLELLFLHYYEEICRKNGRDPQRIVVLVARPAFSLMVEEYIREIERRIVEVEAREDEKREPTSFDLYRDLLDYQALFTKLLEEFDQTRKGPAPAAAWAARRDAWIALVDGFLARAARYKGSAIDTSHREVKAGLSTELAELAKGLIELDAKFAEEIGKDAGGGASPLPAALEGTVKAIRARFQVLYDIVLAERASVLVEVEKRLEAFRVLSEELDAANAKAARGGAGRRGEWTAWLPGWRDRLRMAREDLAQWRRQTQATFHLPDAPRRLDLMGEILSCLADLYDATIAGKTADTTVERIEYNRDLREKVRHQILAELEEAKKSR